MIKIILYAMFISLTGLGHAFAETRVVAISLADGVLSSPDDTLRFNKGDHVVIQWSSDSAMDLHLHGYDVKTKLKPGKTSEMVFDAKVTGRFAVNSHGHGHAKKGQGTSAIKLGHGEKAVMYIEVHP